MARRNFNLDYAIQSVWYSQSNASHNIAHTHILILLHNFHFIPTQFTVYGTNAGWEVKSCIYYWDTNKRFMDFRVSPINSSLIHQTNIFVGLIKNKKWRKHEKQQIDNRLCRSRVCDLPSIDRLRVKRGREWEMCGAI